MTVRCSIPHYLAAADSPPDFRGQVWGGSVDKKPHAKILRFDRSLDQGPEITCFLRMREATALSSVSPRGSLGRTLAVKDGKNPLFFGTRQLSNHFGKVGQDRLQNIQNFIHLLLVDD